MPVSLQLTDAVLAQATAQAPDVRLFLEGLVTEPPIQVAGVRTLAATQSQESFTSVPEALILALKDGHFLEKTHIQ